MVRRRIFVSHSNGDEVALEYLEVVAAELEAEGFDVLVDRKRLVAGTSWRDEIYTWMGMCHAAVILVSEAAIRPGSVWVPRETSILLWRRTLDPKFLVLPACIGGVGPEELREGVFADMQLGEIQTVPARTPKELVEGLKERLRLLLAPKTPLEGLASRLVELLRPVSDVAVDEAMDKLGVDLGPCHPVGDSRLALSLALLQTPPRASLDAMEVLAESMTNSSDFDQVLAMVAPAWVNVCAARWIAESGACLTEKPVLVLNASTDLCARHYVDRASYKPLRTRWPLVTSTGVHGEEVADEIEAELKGNLIQDLRLVGDGEERLMELLAERNRTGHPTFAALRYSQAVAGALPQLQRRLPSVTFILLSGDEFPTHHNLESGRARFVEPRLEPGAETRARLDYDYIRSIIRPEAQRGIHVP